MCLGCANVYLKSNNHHSPEQLKDVMIQMIMIKMIQNNKDEKT